MKRSRFIKKVLNSKQNTVFTTAEQVENALNIFEKLGMMPPAQETFTVSTLSGKALGELDSTYEWESEDETK